MKIQIIEKGQVISTIYSDEDGYFTIDEDITLNVTFRLIPYEDK